MPGNHIPFSAGAKDSITETIMINVVQEKFDVIWGRVQSGPVGQFFRWWIAELRQAMPKSWQAKLDHALRRVVLSVDEAQITVAVDESRAVRELDHFPLSQEAGLQFEQVQELLDGNELAEAPRFLLIDIDQVLRKTIRLPAAAEANLSQVLGFEMDRQTPFSAASVYYDYRITGRDADAGQVSIELFVVPRAVVDRQIETLSARKLTLAGVDIGEDSTTLGLNLLPPDRRVRATSPRTRTNAALAASCVLLLIAVMAGSLQLRQHQLEELELAIADVQGEARQVMRIKENIKDTSEAAGFLATRRAEMPMAIEVLADVTRILPDDTYLDRLVISKDKVQMQGKSQNAQQLIELVNESDLLDEAAFRGSTRLDARSGLEIFEVNADLAGVVTD